VYVSESSGPHRHHNMKPRSGEHNRKLAAPYVFWSVIIAALVSSCDSGERREPRSSRSIIADIILTIDNRTPQSVLVYLRSEGRSDSLGQVARRSTRSFSLPSGSGDSTTALRLEARRTRIGSSTLSTVFHLASGHQVVWALDQSRTGTLTMR